MQMLTRSTIATLRKLSNISRKLLYHTSMGREKGGDADQYALLIWEVFCEQKTEAVTLLQEQKILK